MKTHITLYCSILLCGALSIFAGMDDARLKEKLTDRLLMLLTEENFSSRKIGVPDEHYHSELKEVSDEQFHRVLMELYKEAESKWPTLTPNTEEWTKNKQDVIGVLACLSKCGDIPVKDFLLDYVASNENDSQLRGVAMLSYLRVADAQETKDVLLRFLVDEDRINPMERLSLYSFARMAYDEASSEKRAAILVALFTAAVKEEGKIEFMKVDKILAEKSVAYRHSIERLAMLERHSEEPPTTNLYTDRDLKTALAESRSYTQHTSVSTNLVSLAVRDFKLPHPYVVTNSEARAIPADPVTEPVTADAAGRSPGRRVLFGALALLLLGFGAWRFMRK